MQKSKISWTEYVWNFVVGCETGCPYCYAKIYVRRFYKEYIRREMDYNLNVKKDSTFTGHHLFDLKNFKPTFFYNAFDKDFSKVKERSKIFVNPFSDIMWWKEEWMEKCLKKINDRYLIHRFIFLTKFPFIYQKYKFPYNCFLGATIVDDDALLFLSDPVHFISFEPLFSRITVKNIPENIRWVIIGAETGPRKNRVKPKREWIEEIIDYCKIKSIPVFMKENLVEVWDGEYLNEYPDFFK